MRRVLNFVFRELNQQYVTKVHLKDIRIAYTNGKPNSYKEVSISGLRQFIDTLIVPEKADKVMQQILKLVSVIFDVGDEPVKTLESFQMAADGHSWTRNESPALVSNEYPAPTENLIYRFKRGPLGQEGKKNRVDGVLMKENGIVMRTDSVIVEALLGEADSLDSYAMEVQLAAAKDKTLANEREALIQSTLSSISDAEKRAQAIAAIYVPAKKDLPPAAAGTP